MTIREAYEQTFINLNKKKAAALYVEDFLVFFKNAVQDHINRLYSLYETSQQLSDDLQNLHRHIIIDLSGDMPFPLNINYYDGEPYVSFLYNDSISPLGTGHFMLDTNGDRYTSLDVIANRNIIVNMEAPSFPLIPELDLLKFPNGINEGIIIKIEAAEMKDMITLKDWRSSTSPTQRDFSFDLGDINEITVTPQNSVFLIHKDNKFRLLSGSGFKEVDEERMLISAPDNYFHLLGLENYLGTRKGVTCENWRTKRYGVSKLTSDREVSINQNVFLEPKSTRPYYSIKNNIGSVYPNIEVHYRKDSELELVKLDKIGLLYLKEPKIYFMDDADLKGDDSTEVIEFQEYICQELVESVVRLVLENNSDPRVQSFPAVNESNNMSRGLPGNTREKVK